MHWIAFETGIKSVIRLGWLIWWRKSFLLLWIGPKVLINASNCHETHLKCAEMKNSKPISRIELKISFYLGKLHLNAKLARWNRTETGLIQLIWRLNNSTSKFDWNASKCLKTTLKRIEMTWNGIKRPLMENAGLVEKAGCQIGLKCSEMIRNAQKRALTGLNLHFILS